GWLAWWWQGRSMRSTGSGGRRIRCATSPGESSGARSNVVTSKARLDVELVSRGLAKSREEARRIILAGEVRIGDRVARKASEGVEPEARLAIGAKPRLGSSVEGMLSSALSASGCGFYG